MMPDSMISCFRSRRAGDPVPTSPSSSILTTSFYHTALGIAAVTWDRTLLGRSLRVDLHFRDYRGGDSSYHVHLNPWLLWRKCGSKAFLLHDETRVKLSWDLRRAKFDNSLDPPSGFCLSILVDGEVTLLVGDSREQNPCARRPFKSPILLLRREHIFGDNSFETKASFGGKTRDISVHYTHVPDDPKLTFCVDQKEVLQVKSLQWKFRGNEMVEVNGSRIQVSWDVKNWLFGQSPEDNRAVFLLRIDDHGKSEDSENWNFNNEGPASWWPWEKSKMGAKASKRAKSLLKTSSSSSFSSVSSLSSSPVVGWSTAEESELQSLGGFSLLMFAWRN